MIRLTWPQAISWHLRRQHLDARLPRTKLIQAASRLCGLHAQVMSSAELTALCRVDGLRPADISQALWRDRRLVKTWAMRQTLHLLPAAEYSMWLNAFDFHSGAKTPQWLAYFGVTQEELEAITEAVPVALGDRLLTRQELAEEIVRLTGLAKVQDKLRMGWGSLLKPACYRGYLCFGPNRGQQTQFARPGGLRNGFRESRAEIARRYLSAYGPATPRDFSRWLSGGAGYRAAKEMLSSLGDEIMEVDIEGSRAFMLKKHLRPARQSDPVQSVRLLPAFDQYVFAAGTRSARVLPGDYHSRIYRSQGWFSPVLLVDGRMDGVWRFERRENRLEIAIEPFVELKPKVKRAAAEEAERIAQFMGKPLELYWR